MLNLQCNYEEHTADVKENQILVWTLYIIGRSSLCSERVSPDSTKSLSRSTRISNAATLYCRRLYQPDI